MFRDRRLLGPQHALQGTPFEAAEGILAVDGEHLAQLAAGFALDLAVAAIEQLPTMAGWIDGDDALEDRVARAISIGEAHHEYLVPVMANAIVYRNTVPELLDALRDHVLAPRRAVIEAIVGKRAGGRAYDGPGVEKLQLQANPAHPIVPGGFSKNGELYLPGGRGIIRLKPGDYIGVDHYGWPIVVSAESIADPSSSWAHS